MKKIKRCNKIILIFITLLTIISISNICNAAEITSDEYKITEIEKEKYIIGIYQNTRAETVKNNIKTESTIKIYNEEGQGITDETIVKTGNKIQIGNNTYIAIVCGDVNGDGNVSVTDLAKIKAHIIGKEISEGAKGIATDVDASGKVTSTDILNLKRLIVRIIEEREIFEGKYSNNEYTYKKNKLTEKITITELKNENASGVLQIPSKIDGNEVKEIEGFIGENNKITKVTIPSGIEKISKTAFSGLTKVEEIQVSGLNEKYSSEEGILYNKGKEEIVFYPRGKRGTEYTIKGTVKAVGEYAFYKNSTLEKLYIPDTVEEIEKTAFEEMKGKVYVKEGASLIGKLKAKGIAYEIDGRPEIKKLTTNVGTNRVITLNIEATDDVGIVAWGICIKGSENIQWKEVTSTKKLSTTYKDFKQNGTYEVKIKDTVGNIESKEIKITELDTTIAEVTEIKIVSPTSGEYEPGQKIVIRVQFSEKVKGTAPTLKLKIGDEIVTATGTNPAGTQDYIEYTYTTTDNNTGKVETYSYSEGDLTDVAGNKVIIAKLANSGNTITIKSNYNPKYPVYNYPVSGTVVEKYEDESINISIEKIGSLYVSKIWIAEPSKQIGKAVGYDLVGNMISEIPGVIIGTNASYGADVGRVVITNGVVTGIQDNDGSHYLLGIDKNGKLVQRALYKKSGGLKSTISAEEMLRMGIVNTFPSWPGSIIEYGEKRNFNLVDQHSDKRARTAIGQINDNNYVLINAKDRSEGVPMRAVGEMGLTLKCSMLFILDGGGSTQLWYRGRYIISSSDNRKRPDAIYFKTLE